MSGDRVELVTAPDAGALIARYVGADAVRLSPAALETLAIVAYRQPVTKSAVERIRGVDSDYTIRSLLHRRLVVELGRSEAPGRPFLYGTGFEFLERFGLTSLEELPPLDVDVAARLDRGRGGRGPEASSSPGTPVGTVRGERGGRGHRGARIGPASADARRSGSRRSSRRRGRLAPGERGADRRRPRPGRRRVGDARSAVDPERAHIEVDGRPIGDGRRARRTCCSTSRPASPRPRATATPTTTVLDLVPTALVPDGARLYPVGRLDQDSEGLLLLTNDGAWAERVLHPRFGVEREYALGRPAAADAEQAEALEAGIALEEGSRRSTTCDR